MDNLTMGWATQYPNKEYLQIPVPVQSLGPSAWVAALWR